MNEEEKQRRVEKNRLFGALYGQQASVPRATTRSKSAVAFPMLEGGVPVDQKIVFSSEMDFSKVEARIKAAFESRHETLYSSMHGTGFEPDPPRDEAWYIRMLDNWSTYVITGGQRSGKARIMDLSLGRVYSNQKMVMVQPRRGGSWHLAAPTLQQISKKPVGHSRSEPPFDRSHANTMVIDALKPWVRMEWSS